MSYLTAYEIADELGISVRRAYELAHELEHVRIGRLIRVERRVLDRHLERNTWDDSTDDESGTAASERSGGTSSTASGSRRSVPIGKPRKQRPGESSEKRQIRFTKPRTRQTSKSA